MSNLAFPQLTSGALVQYPIRKRRIIQSPINAFADGSMIPSQMNTNSAFGWQVAYRDLAPGDQTALQNLFSACQGPLLSFIFIDPTDNMLSYSSNLKIGNWLVDPLLSIAAGAADPFGGTSAFLLVNGGQTDQRVSQTIMAPANYSYCFSVYVSAEVPSSVSLSSMAVSQQSQSFPVGLNWTRLVSNGILPDNQIGITFSIVVPGAQTVAVFGPQMEPQVRSIALQAHRYSRWSLPKRPLPWQ